MKTIRIILPVVGIFFSIYLLFAGGVRESTTVIPSTDINSQEFLAKGYSLATLAGGCFWCMEPPYDKTPGIISTTSGFSGGTLVNPSYEQVVRGGTGHLEVVQLVYDPALLSFEDILNIFWVNIDPLDGGGQFCDRGAHYRSAIFFHDEDQRQAALISLEQLQTSGLLQGNIVTEILPYEAFYPAEEYHQDYYLKNSVRYDFYRTRCGRDDRLYQLWKGAESLGL